MMPGYDSWLEQPYQDELEQEERYVRFCEDLCEECAEYQQLTQRYDACTDPEEMERLRDQMLVIEQREIKANDWQGD